MRSKTLLKYLLIVSDAVAQLTALKVAGIVVQGPLVMVILKAHILHKAPELLAPSSMFKLSVSWVHRFVQDVMNWSSCKGTQVAHKIPPNGADLCKLAFLRLIFAIALHGIKPSMIINADQAGITLMPSGKQTYEVRGSKDVTVHAHEEKHQILQFQSVWGGSTKASLPSKDAPRRDEADQLGFKYAHGDTCHWSSKETTKKVHSSAWIIKVLILFLDKQIKNDPSLNEDSKAILLIDVWPVHIAKKNPDDFLPWLHATYKNRCFQPADIGLQHIVKHIVKQSAVDFLVGSATQKLMSGQKASNVILPTDLPTLRNASIAWLLDAYNHLDERPELVWKAWKKCEANGWNLSYECLTSAAARERLEEVMRSNLEFSAEFRRFDIVTGNVEGDLEGVFESPDDNLTLDTDVLAKACLAAGTAREMSGEVDVGSDDEFLDSSGNDLDFEAIDNSPVAVAMIDSPPDVIQATSSPSKSFNEAPPAGGPSCRCSPSTLPGPQTNQL
ncbi:hypothetical protein BN946_scf184902.g1 [Trametes cinnabarina]|uniref:DDE-1 domain-containing protein n=1 Tax=Pycnoporus cinnabarinus TaxID=5643 RepID=A0A060SSF2_PYCCI|nr:hypothetical protein BN946_scf184902.g1 [Trametes cinnabarina]